MGVAPPGLPPPLMDEQTAAELMPVDSTWDALARSAIDMFCYCTCGNRVRVRWIRKSLLRWCCRRRMRCGRFDYQPESATFGWDTQSGGFVACQSCGRIKRTYV